MRYSDISIPLREFTDQTRQIATLVRYVADYVKGGATTRQNCESVIYNLLTKNDVRGQSFVQDVNSKDQVTSQWMKWYQDFKSKLAEYAQTLGWRYNDEAWAHYSRQGTADNNEHRKMYVSVDPQTLGTDLPKLSMLMRALDTAVPKPNKVSLKIPGTFGMMYAHRDSIVIHFPAAQFQQAVQQAVASVGLNVLDRSQFGRTDFGQDAAKEDGSHGSDSELVAERVMRSIDTAKAQVQQMTTEQLQAALLTLIKKASLATR